MNKALAFHKGLGKHLPIVDKFVSEGLGNSGNDLYGIPCFGSLISLALWCLDFVVD